MDDLTGRTTPSHALVTTRQPRSRWRWLVWVVVLVGLVAGGYYGWRALTGSGAGSRRAAQPAQPVGVATVGKRDIRVIDNAIGTVTSLATVTVKTQIAGKITEIAFKEGETVPAGQFLVQIDPRPYQVALEQAQGALARDQAQLKNAQVDLARYQTLLRQDSVSRQQVDTQAALVRQYEGTLKTDQAAIDSAQLNLVYCHIVSPVAGRVGLRQVDLGNYVQPSDSTGLVVVTQVEPISVVFALPQDQIPAVVKATRAGRTLAVEAWDRADQNKLATGQLGSIDNQVDVTTGTVKLRGMFANGDGILFPNQFVNAKLVVDTLQGALAIPGAAIQRGAPGTFVYLIKADDTVHVQPIKLGPTDGGFVAVADGLSEGDKIVTDGADRLREGAKVMEPQANGGQAAAQAPSGDEQQRGQQRRRRAQ